MLLDPGSKIFSRLGAVSIVNAVNNAPVTRMVEGKRAALSAGNGLCSAVGLVNTEEKEGETERTSYPGWWCGTVLSDLQVIHKHRPRAQGAVP